MIEEAEVVLHEADEPQAVFDLFDADILPANATLRLILRLSKQIRPQRVTVTMRSWNG